MALTFFKYLKKPQRQFNIPYRFYDPEQEKRDAREARIRKEIDEERGIRTLGDYRSTIKGSFRGHRGSGAMHESLKNNRTVKVLLWVFILAMLAYLFLR